MVQGKDLGALLRSWLKGPGSFRYHHMPSRAEWRRLCHGVAEDFCNMIICFDRSAEENAPALKDRWPLNKASGSCADEACVAPAGRLFPVPGC